jgi:hypothetical protein
MLRAVSNAELERWVTEMAELCTPDEDFAGTRAVGRRNRLSEVCA